MAISIFKKLNWKKDGSPFGWGDSPDADWKTIFLLTITFIVIVSVWNVVTYFKVKGEILTFEEDSGETLTLDLEALRDTVRYYESKSIEFERIKEGSSTNTAVTDPSV